MYNTNMRINLSRVLIGLVLVMNVQAAVAYLVTPERYAPGFELSGAIGEAVIRALGVLFLMWNVPYAVALWNPVRQWASLYTAIAMQAIGLVGESWIALTLPAVHEVARGSFARFIVFDGLGLLALVAAAWVIRRESYKT